ncbi:unnamed protein product [Closterium sp. NIES-64]|nr:unnamed protein product [Closterium sp. NIES-64]
MFTQITGMGPWATGQQGWTTPPTQQELADKTATEQSTSRRYGVKLSPPYLLPVPLDCHGPATHFLSLMSSHGCIVRRGGEWGENKAVLGVFSRRKAKMTTIITSTSGLLAVSLAGSVLRLLCAFIILTLRNEELPSRDDGDLRSPGCC